MKQVSHTNKSRIIDTKPSPYAMHACAPRRPTKVPRAVRQLVAACLTCVVLSTNTLQEIRAPRRANGTQLLLIISAVECRLRSSPNPGPAPAFQSLPGVCQGRRLRVAPALASAKETFKQNMKQLHQLLPSCSIAICKSHTLYSARS